MSRSRYQQVSQADEIIDLNTITNDPSYNYNSGIPNSPPPSFHSSQAIDQFDEPPTPTNVQPRPPLIDTSRLSPVSFSASATRTGPTGHESIVLHLQRRIDRLEEAVGRMLIDKGPSGSSKSADSRSNCCVHFADELPPAEAYDIRAGSNCCVTFGGTQTRTRNEVFFRRLFLVMVPLFTITFAVVIASAILAKVNGPRTCSDCPNGGHGGVS